MKQFLTPLKWLLEVTNSVIFFLILFFSLAATINAFGQTFSLTNDKRGMYVNNFLEVDATGNTITAYSVLGINSKEDDLL